MLQALLDWRKIVDLQYNGETVFRVTMSFPELLGPSHERDIQVVRSWDELPPLPEKHSPGYWRQVWEAQQAEQQQPEEAAPEPAEPRYWPVPPPNPAKRRFYPAPEDLLRLEPQPLPSVPSIDDLQRTADAMSQTMAAIGNRAAAPWLGWKTMATSLDAMQQMFGIAPAKADERVQAAAADRVSTSSDAKQASSPPPAPAAAPADAPGQVSAASAGDKGGLARTVLDTVTDPHNLLAATSLIPGPAGPVATLANAAISTDTDPHDLLTAASLLPGPAGTVATVVDAGVEFQEGHDTNALIDLAAAAAGFFTDAGAVKAGLTATKELVAGEKLAAKTAEEAAEAAKLKAAKPHAAPPAEPPHEAPPAEPPRHEAPPEPEHTENSLEQNKKISDIRTSGLKLVPRRGMKSRVVTDIHGREVPIYGQEKGSSTTDGHAEAMIEEAERMARTGEYEYITLQRSLRTATGRVSKGRRMPDIIGVRRDGRVEQVEVESDSDIEEKLIQRMAESNLTLPAHRRMDGRVIHPAPKGGQ
jgi:hypothetical protein